MMRRRKWEEKRKAMKRCTRQTEEKTVRTCKRITAESVSAFLYHTAADVPSYHTHKCAHRAVELHLNTSGQFSLTQIL